jgi:hypothetical protein
MTANNRVKEIQEEYFDFCLSLLQKIPIEEINEKQLATKAHSFKESLKQAIIEYEQNFYSEGIEFLQKEIVRLKEALQNKAQDTGV